MVAWQRAALGRVVASTASVGGAEFQEARAMGGVEDSPLAEEEAQRRFQANSGVTAALDEDDAMFTYSSY